MLLRLQRMAMLRHNLNGIEIVTEDDQSSPPGAVGAANKLIQAEIKFIIPPLFIPSHLAITPITEEVKVLCMKAMGAGRDQANPNLRYSFVSGRGRMAGEDFFGINHVIRKPITMSGIRKNKVVCEFSNRD